ncbi:MAG: Mur ligase family protein [Patescibacteria group bacterium]|nr:Mur ligase family protein [Patescibacteria group bacterium]MDD5715224.1 Mur ligase family protein [Patescibacteria group bacterium]
MINGLKKIIEWKLRVIARLVLKKYRPQIIGVTGSVGKTSTKEAIFTVLRAKFRVWKNIKNYNNEFGVPLSILGKESGFRNPFAWIGILLYGLGLLLFRKRNYPEYLVLEMGADKPGDIEYLTQFAPCHVGVVTSVGHVHTELFGTIEKVAREKMHIVSHLKKDDIAVLNVDDPIVMGMRDKVRARVMTFGYAENADIRASEVRISTGTSPDPWVAGEVQGVSFKLQYKGSVVPMLLPSVLGAHQVYSALAAIAVGISLGMNLADISAALKLFKSPPGRMRLLPGIKRTSLIDDSYNSSPMAAKAALRVVKDIQISGKKFIALGDMLELGAYTEEGHRDVGAAAAGVADVLVCVGERAAMIADEAKKRGMSEDRVFHFGSTLEAGKFIQDRLRQGDMVLVKGSQGARMERVVKELMAEPLKAAEMLVRQGPEWQ